MPSAKLLQFLHEQAVDYDLIHHANAVSARDVANRTGVSQSAFAKTVMVRIDGKPALVVLPADSHIDWELLRAAAGARRVEICRGCECEDAFPDCEAGAMPPVGPLYGLPVYLAGGLLRAERIAFNAGTHTETVAMRLEDFRRLVQPRVGHFAKRGGIARQARA